MAIALSRSRQVGGPVRLGLPSSCRATVQWDRPPDYEAPWLRWFRGIQLHLTQFPDRLAVVGTLDTHRQPLPPEAKEADQKVALPSMNFDLFQLPFKMFGGKEEAQPAKPQSRKF